MSLYSSTCPTGCDNTAPDVSFDDCARAFAFGQIKNIYFMSKDGAAFTTFGTAPFAAEFHARIAETGGTVDSIRPMSVLGTLAPPTRDELVVSGFQKIKTPGTYVVNFSIDDLSDENIALIRKSQCNIKVMFWYETPDLFGGGNTGIEADMIIDLDIPEGENTLNKGMGTLTWRAKQMPEVIRNPFI